MHIRIWNCTLQQLEGAEIKVSLFRELTATKGYLFKDWCVSEWQRVCQRCTLQPLPGVSVSLTAASPFPSVSVVFILQYWTAKRNKYNNKKKKILQRGVWSMIRPFGYLQYTTLQLYCLCVEKFAFWLVIYIKTFNTVNNKTSTTQ